jgi:CRP-like cAMP-binding protein
MGVEVEFLKSKPYFSRLNTDDLDSIKGLFFEKTFGRGEIIVIEGESADALYFVYSGAVKTFRTSLDGREQVLNILRPGESFNDVAIFDGGPNLATARAMGPSVVFGISKTDLLAFLERHPRMALSVLQVLSSQMRYFVSLIDDLSFKPVVSRVAKILFEHAGDGASSGERITQQDMAAIAGTVREVIGRSLKSLEREGVIKFDRHRIVITNKEALRNIAGIPS